MSERVVTARGDLERVCAAVRANSVCALDTEFLRERTYYAQLCLLQCATADGLWCVDPLALDDLEPLLAALYDSAVTKVLHSARQDLELFYDLRGAIPVPVFDTQLAAAMTGFGDQVGYAALVDRLAGVQLAKSHTRADWCRRPLSDAELDYAEDDVRYLHALHDHLSERLRVLGREAWFDEETARLTDVSTYANPPQEAWRRLRGAAQLGAEEQGVLRALAAWRERVAQQRNLPRGWVLPDAALQRLAREMPTDAGSLADVEELPRALRERRAPELIGVIREARAHPPGDPAAQASRLGAAEKRLVGRLMEVLRRRAEEIEIAPSILGTRRDVERLVAGSGEVALVRGWRRDVVGDELLRIMGEG
jgi:ribonuclease D